ncbi:hypothetical protein B488_06850 [Liberibacter crescens BT-1]|uniref:Uncharacterized protein n=1 Tax=Liberibacter crescens (strain BT-1) TaxID=1215343 RepID=L0EUN7_LIBCB|nr:hypothetical protein B488_06850 [Liberibacter crescens BT-1]
MIHKNPVIVISRPSLKIKGFHSWTIEEIEQSPPKAIIRNLEYPS